MVALAATTILPGWLVLPAAALTMLVVAVHVLATHAGDLPLRRKRLRIANGLLMMLLVALLAYALGVAAVVHEPRTAPKEAREFVVVWLSIIGLVALVVTLAAADAIATVVHGWALRKELRAEMRSGLKGDLVARRAVGAAGRPSQDQSSGRA